MAVTAVTGGHVTDVRETNAVIREIVETRNSGKYPEPAPRCCGGCEPQGRDDDDDEIADEVADAADMGISPAALPRVGTKPSNPKDLIGSDKVPLHLWPTTATAMGSIALLNGALKYGRANWRGIGVRASIYVDACHRHLSAWFEGEATDEEGVPHLSSALACLAILVDAQAAGKLNDDRQYPGGHRRLMDELTPLVVKLKALHAPREEPAHWTIQK